MGTGASIIGIFIAIFSVLLILIVLSHSIAAIELVLSVLRLLILRLYLDHFFLFGLAVPLVVSVDV